MGPKWSQTEPKPERLRHLSARPSDSGDVAVICKSRQIAPLSMVSLGDTFAYELTATAQADVAEVTVMDGIPAGVSYVSSVPSAARMATS